MFLILIDLARLAEVRKRREEQTKKAIAEGRAIAMSANGLEDGSDSDSDEAGNKKSSGLPAIGGITLSESAAKKRAVALGSVEDSTVSSVSGGPPILKAMDIKKMNGDALKDALKERGLGVQGQKKDLIQRLIDHESARAK